MAEIEEPKGENVKEVLQSGMGPKVTRFIIACLGGLPVKKVSKQLFAA